MQSAKNATFRHAVLSPTMDHGGHSLIAACTNDCRAFIYAPASITATTYSTHWDLVQTLSDELYLRLKENRFDPDDRESLQNDYNWSYVEEEFGTASSKKKKTPLKINMLEARWQADLMDVHCVGWSPRIHATTGGGGGGGGGEAFSLLAMGGKISLSLWRLDLTARRDHAVGYKLELLGVHKPHAGWTLHLRWRPGPQAVLATGSSEGEGSTEQTQVCVAAGAVPQLVRLMSSSSWDVREQATWALGNIAGDKPQIRDYVLSQGMMPTLLAIHALPDLKLSVARTSTWALCNLCRGKPSPNFGTVRVALPTLCKLAFSQDNDIVVDSLWSLAYLSDGPEEQIQAIIDTGVCRRFIALLTHHSPSIQTPALRIIGNIATGSEAQTQHIIDCGALPALAAMLSNSSRFKRPIVKEALWTISNVSAGGEQQIKSILDHGILPIVLPHLIGQDEDLKKETAWIIGNILSAATAQVINYVISTGCMPAYLELLGHKQGSTVILVLDSIIQIMSVLLGGLYSQVQSDLLASVTAIRKLLCAHATERYLAQTVVEGNVIPILVCLLSTGDHNPQLQFETSWILTLIASQQYTQACVAAGVVPHFIRLMSSPNSDVREQAVWGLGTIVADETDIRDHVLAQGVISSLLTLLARNDLTISMTRNLTFTLSNLCRGKPLPEFDRVCPALPALSKLILSSDEAILIDALCALSSMSAEDSEQIQAVIDTGVCRHISKFLAHPSHKVRAPAIRIVGNIVTGDEEQTQHIIDSGAIPALASILKDPSTPRKDTREILWTISNISAGSAEQIKLIVKHGMIPLVVPYLIVQDEDLKKETGWIIGNMLALSSLSHIQASCSLYEFIDKPVKQTLPVSGGNINGISNWNTFSDSVKSAQFARNSISRSMPPRRRILINGVALRDQELYVVGKLWKQDPDERISLFDALKAILDLPPIYVRHIDMVDSMYDLYKNHYLQFTKQCQEKPVTNAMAEERLSLLLSDLAALSISVREQAATRD
eukprot:gene15512-18423_t